MGQPKKDIDVRMDTTEVSKYLDSLRGKLTKQQLIDIDNVVDTIKSRVIKAIETDSLLELNSLKKNTTLKKLTDEAHKSMPNAPRDLFVRKLHFVMNAFQNRIDPRIKLLKFRQQQNATKVSGDAVEPPPQSPIAMATSTPLPSQNGNTGATEEPALESGDATIVEPTQHFSGTSSPCTPVSSQDGTQSAASQESSGPNDVGHPTHTDVATQTGPSTTCIPTCKYLDTGAAPSVKGKGSWIRCILCMKWCHAECCGEDGKYEGAFACFDCRSMSSQLTDIRSVLQEVTSQLAALKATVEGSTSKQVAHSSETAIYSPPQPVHPPPQHSAQPSHVYADVVINPQVPVHNTFDALHDSKEEDGVSSEAGNEVGEMSGLPCNQEAWLEAKAAKHRKKKAAKKPNTNCQPTHVTILTDSILRNVDVKRTESLCGEGQCKLTFMRSAGNIGSAVDCIQRDAIPRTEPVVIHTGTNHVEDEIPKKTIDRFERLATNLRAQKYERVALSSIVYRRSFSSRTRNRIQTINTALSELCTKNQWFFIDNDNVDESCLLHGDKAHTNKYGDERLSHNLAKGIKELLKPRLNK
jgi:hypothetical protein